MEDYRVIADALAADIGAGRLMPGQRLAPQREFARERGIASSTAARVYAELIRRGLAVGEVGRGTFVRAGGPPVEPALAEPVAGRVDLDINFPMLPDQPALLAESLAPLLRPDVLASALQPAAATGTPAAREAGAALLARTGWTPDPRHLLFAGGGRQAIAAAIAALVPIGERLAVESLTYPMVKSIAARLGVNLVALAMDGEGLVPAALRAAHRSGPLRALYVQPILHNPLGVTMSERRRAELARVLEELDLPAIEDSIYGFLADEETPLAALAPTRVVLIDSLSKRIAPGLTLGLAATPPAMAERIAAALRSGAWTASRFALDAATRWITDGTAARLAAAKRAAASARLATVRARLRGLAVRGDPRAYHCWWELPEAWRAETFVAAASRRGIAVTPAAAFAVSPGHAPSAVRLALASPSPSALLSALDVLAGLAGSTPEDAGVE